MHKSVHENFIKFTEPLEGKVAYMYADVKQLVTIGIGNLIDPVEAALGLKFVWKKGEANAGKPASKDDIKTEWQVVKDDKALAKKGHLAAAKVTHLELLPADIDKLVLGKLDENAKILVKYFKDFDKMPADGQLGLLSMSWALGPNLPKVFPHFSKSVNAGDWAGAAEQCKLQEKGNAGVIPRNKANKLLFTNAKAVADAGSDVTKLWWPKSP
jgi:GH24 family phage-related lysozyme (muramidase)